MACGRAIGAPMRRLFSSMVEVTGGDRGVDLTLDVPDRKAIDVVGERGQIVGEVLAAGPEHCGCLVVDRSDAEQTHQSKVAAWAVSSSSTDASWP